MPTSKYPKDIPREERSYEVLYNGLDLLAEHDVKAGSHTPNEMRIEEEHPGAIYDEAAKQEEEKALNTVMYSMDEADLSYLERSGLKMFEDTFELIIDRLEKEWFLFVQDLINKYVTPIEVRGYCDVCTGAQNEEDDILLICQGCHLVVHEDCYGIQSPSDFWLCRKCLLQETKVTCSFCPSVDGAFKQTSDLRWGHVTCSLFNKTLSFGHPTSKDPIDVDRYKRETGCQFCEDANGTVISCSYFMCKERYHVSCALDKCYFDINNRISYCIEHDPLRNFHLNGSRAVYSLKYFDYERIRYTPKVRKKVRLTEAKASLFMRLCNLAPAATKAMISRILKHDIKDKEVESDLERVSKYWQAKRRASNDSLLELSDLRFGNDFGKKWIETRKADGS